MITKIRKPSDTEYISKKEAPKITPIFPTKNRESGHTVGFGGVAIS